MIPRPNIFFIRTLSLILLTLIFKINPSDIIIILLTVIYKFILLVYWLYYKLWYIEVTHGYVYEIINCDIGDQFINLCIVLWTGIYRITRGYIYNIVKCFIYSSKTLYVIWNRELFNIFIKNIKKTGYTVENFF